MRSDECYDLFWNEVALLADQFDVEEPQILTAPVVFPRCFQWRTCFILPFLLHSMLLFGSILYTTAHKVKENNEVGAGETLLKVGHGNE